MIYTIGHSTRSSDEFINILKTANVSCLVDVRSFPGSRRVPQFNKFSMEQWLPENDIEYIHEPRLGGRRKKSLDPSPNTLWTNISFRNYADYATANPDFTIALNWLIDLSKKKTVAYMCAELQWWKCHRRIISDYLLTKNVDVIHLGLGKPALHQLTAGAKMKDGEISYSKHTVSQLSFL